jgi:hypothetical protein
MFESVFDTDLDLRSEAVVRGVNRRTHDRGEAGLDYSLPADNDEDAASLWI